VNHASASAFAPIPSPVARVGSHFGAYRILAELGSGGMGRVFHVEHVALRRQLALKVLHQHVLRRDPDSVARLLREARAAARIAHPRVVKVLDYDVLADGRPYLVMELLRGERLADLLDGGALDPAQAVAIARQAAEGLAAAHARGVVHADVSSSNLVVETGRAGLRVKLVDFGLAVVADEPIAITLDDLEGRDLVYGTPSYIAPEQIRGRCAEPRSDQYGLGVVLFEMLCGVRPFGGRDIRAICVAHLRNPVPALRSPHGELPPELVALVLRLLAKQAVDRYPTMDAVADELAAIGLANYGRP
jgi:eukaryotic-like serine/threonine-protein kinase